MFSPLSSVVQLAVLLGRVIHHESIPESKSLDDAIMNIYLIICLKISLIIVWLILSLSDSLRSSLSDGLSAYFTDKLPLCLSVCLCG